MKTARQLTVFVLFAGITAMTTALEVEMPSVVAHNDVVYLTPARSGWEGLPLGNGTFGAQVWQPDGLMFQMNTPLSGVYGGAIARLYLRSDLPLLSNLAGYRQKLALYDPNLTTELSYDQGNVSMTAFIPADQDALVLHYTDTRPEATGGAVELQTWRKGVVRQAENGRLVLTDTLKYQKQPDYRFALAVEIEGAAAVAEVGDEQMLRLKANGPTFTAWLAFAATRDPKVDITAAAVAKLAALKALGLPAVRKTHAAWWAKFWDRSFIQLTSEDGQADYLANLWYMHIYAMGAGSRGEVPPKFNGGLWTDQRDEREWGTGYWHWNTQETYWPLYAANHLELLQPYYDLYWNMLPTVKDWTKKFWETDGAQFQETIPFTGEMAVFEKARGLHPRLPVPKTVAHTNLILSSSAEIAMQFWWNYQYTGDEAFLREKAYPLMKDVITFYVNYLEKDAQGRYNFYPSNAHESFWSVKNPAPDLAAARYLFPVILEASQKLGVDADLRPVWQERLEHLAPYPLDPKTGGILNFEPEPGKEYEWRNAENPDVFPIGVFPLLTQDSPDYELGVKTFHARRNVNGYGWTTDSIAAARLGLGEPAPAGAPPQWAGLQTLLVGHAELYQTHPSGLQDYYPRKPAVHCYLEGSGTFATGMNEMLLQSWDGKIRVCPALPKAWSGAFKLLAQGGFEVTATAEKGKVTSVAIFSQRGGSFTLLNPFDGPMKMTDNGKPGLNMATKTLNYKSQPGHTYLFTPPGAPPAATVTAAPNQAPKLLLPKKLRWLGKPVSVAAAWVPPAETAPPQPPAPLKSIERPAKPEVKIPRLPSAPTLDGDLAADPAWQGLVPIGPFFVLGKTLPATQQTDVLVGSDDNNLYFGITCWEDRMAGQFLEYTPDQRDAPIWSEDSLEIFLKTPFGPPWHLGINALGAMCDSRGTTATNDDVSLNLDWKAVAKRWGNRWTVEIAIPLASLVPDPPTAGATWGFNVGRNEKPHGEISTWAPFTKVAFFNFEEFGRLTFTTGPAGAAAPTIAEPSLIGHWTFANVTGNWVRDASGHQHTGMLTAPLKTVPGKVSTALVFTGAGFVDIPHQPELNMSDALTLALWVNPADKRSARLIDKGPAGGSDSYLLDTHPSSNLRFISSAVGANLDTVTLPLKEWTHVAVTFGQGTFRIYVNGKVVHEKAGVTGKISPTELPLRLGADSQGWSRFAGLMDDVRLYNRALTPEEITALANPPAK